MKSEGDEHKFLFGLVGRAGLEPATNGLKVRILKSTARSFNHLPGHPLHSLHDYSRLSATDSRKTHADCAAPIPGN